MVDEDGAILIGYRVLRTADGLAASKWNRRGSLRLSLYLHLAQRNRGTGLMEEKV